jgi:hypothetical protein
MAGGSRESAAGAIGILIKTKIERKRDGFQFAI